jgi:outer membrane protein OmpA-like peptidoglycan-associated protein
MAYLVNEMLACLIGMAVAGCALGWFVHRIIAGRRMKQMAAEHEHTLTVTEAELQRLSSEIAGANKRAKDAEAALPPLQTRAADAEARVATALMARDAAESKLREQAAGFEHLKENLARREREIVQLEANINKLNPLVTEANSLRGQAAAWERKSRQQEEQAKAQLVQRDNEIAMLRGRVDELESLPAKLIEREARLRDQDVKLRATEAAAQSRIQTLEASLREAEARAQEAARSLQAAEQNTAAALDQRAAETRMLRQRLNDFEAMSTRWAETDQALLAARAELAQRDAQLREVRQPAAMGAAVGAGLPTLAHAVAYPAPAAPAAPAEPAPLTPAELQGCIQSLLFERRVQFLPKSAELTPESMDTLAEVAALMDQAPGVAVIIEGHTDNWGDPHTNWHLSTQRAQAVRAELVLLGVEDRRLSCIGYGEARPIDDNGTPDGRWRNRRIEIRVAPTDVAAS